MPKMFLATKWQNKARLLLVICEQRVGAYDGDNSFFNLQTTADVQYSLKLVLTDDEPIT